MASFISTRKFYLALSIAAFAGVAVTVWMTQFLGLHPCPKCIFQRVLLIAVGLFALLGYLTNLNKPFAILILLTSLGGMATAGYQSYLQWNPALDKCLLGKPDLMEQLVDYLGSLSPQLFLANGLCSSKEWTFLTLSLANWSFVAFTLLALLAAYKLRSKPYKMFFRDS